MSGEEEPLGFLRYVGRPPGQDNVVKTAAVAWHRTADGIREATERLDREVARVIGPQWSAADAGRMLRAWDTLRRDAREVEELLRSMGLELDKLSRSIRDAQQDWDRTMATLAVTIGVSIGLGFVTFGLSNLAAGGAANAAAAATVGIAAWLEGIIQGSGVVLLTLAEASGAISARIAVGFAVNLASQSLSGAIASPDHGFRHVDADQAFLFAGLDAYIGPAAKAALPAKAPGWVVESSAALGSDAIAQLMGPEHTIDPLQMLASGGLGAGAGKVLDATARRLQRARAAIAGEVPPSEVPAPKPLPHGVYQVSSEALDPQLLRTIATKLGVEVDSLKPRQLGADQRGHSGADVWMVEDLEGEGRAVAKMFSLPKQGHRDHQAIQRLHADTFPNMGVVDALVFAQGRTEAGRRVAVLVMSVAPGDSNHAILRTVGIEGGAKRVEALAHAEQAVASGARALVDLHVIPAGSGGPVPQAYVDESISYLMATAQKLVPLKPLLSRHVDVDAALGQLKTLGHGYKANPGGASLVHGDAHPGNFHYDPEVGTTIIDTPNLPFSMDHQGNPIGSAARDYAAYTMKIRSFGLRSKLRPEEIEHLQKAAQRAYREGGGPALTPEAVAFFRARVAIADLVREVAPLKAEGLGSTVSGPIDLLKQHPELAAALAEAKSVLGQ
jgi:phosphotransferase family enzyme